MSSISLCHAFVVLVAVTVVSGQYHVTTFYDDNQCNNLNGGILLNNVGVACTADTNCSLTTYGFYSKQNCTKSGYFAGTPNLVVVYGIPPSDPPCSEIYNSAIRMPLGKCTVGPSSIVKVSGCTGQNSSVILIGYPSLADCQSDSNATPEQVFPTDQCLQTVGADYTADCPTAAPMNEPAPSSAPTAAAPVGTTAPVAAAPARRSNAGYNAIISMGLIVATALVLV